MPAPAGVGAGGPVPPGLEVCRAQATCSLPLGLWSSRKPAALLCACLILHSAVRTPQPCLNPRILLLLLGSVGHCCCCSEKSRFVFGKGLLACCTAQYGHVEQRVGLGLPEGTHSPRTSSKTTTDSELSIPDWSNLFTCRSLFLCLQMSTSTKRDIQMPLRQRNLGYCSELFSSLVLE